MYEEKKVGKIRFFDVVRCNDRDDGQRSGTGRGTGGGILMRQHSVMMQKTLRIRLRRNQVLKNPQRQKQSRKKHQAKKILLLMWEMVPQNRLTL